MHRIHRCGDFFVTRARKNSRCQRRYSRPADKSTGLRFDQTVGLTGLRSFVEPTHFLQIKPFNLTSYRRSSKIAGNIQADVRYSSPIGFEFNCEIRLIGNSASAQKGDERQPQTMHFSLVHEATLF